MAETKGSTAPPGTTESDHFSPYRSDGKLVSLLIPSGFSNLGMVEGVISVEHWVNC